MNVQYHPRVKLASTAFTYIVLTLHVVLVNLYMSVLSHREAQMLFLQWEQQQVQHERQLS